ncbi:hypothetical protein CEN44_16755, partial [Fischerella muscicola CCMEE 5323]
NSIWFAFSHIAFSLNSSFNYHQSEFGIRKGTGSKLKMKRQIQHLSIFSLDALFCHVDDLCKISSPYNV